MSVTVNQLLNTLSSHQGRERGIAACHLAGKLDVSMRRLRRLISEARDQGLAVCGTPGTGYFVPVTPEELAESCAFLEHRALHSLRLLSRMKGVSMPALLGQLNLNQA